VPHRTDSQSAGGLVVEAYSRLHFGLLEIHPGAPHCFGGIGLMIDKPSARLTLLGSQQKGLLDSGQLVLGWDDSYWQDRFEKVYGQYRARTGSSISGVLELTLAPSAHIGLGSGTQFACAASAILNASANAGGSTLQTGGDWLLIDSGRGLRSHIGLHGFLHGQFLVDHGQGGLQRPLAETSRIRLQSFPKDWRIVLIYEDVYLGDFGEDEQAIFDACSKRENPRREQMLDLIEQQILPCLREEDFRGASQAIGNYGELAGEIFRPAVGDAYRSRRIRYWVDRIRGMGIQGVGQSSWGPVVFALVQDDPQAQWLVDKIGSELLPGGWTYVAKVAGPARIEPWGSSLG